MKSLLTLCLLSAFPVAAQTAMDAHRWWLDPHGQDISISVDDLHDEVIPAVPAMDWGRRAVMGAVLRKDILIAVIDGGMELDHPELKAHLALNDAECLEGGIIPAKDGEDKDGNGYKGDCAGWNFVTNDNRPDDIDGHGTHVTGIIRSVMAGAQGQFRFLPLNVFAPNEGTTQSAPGATPLPVRLTRAFEYALSRGVDVIHMSVGWPKSYMTPELEAAIKKVIDRGVAVVAAAGNSSQRAMIYPCRIEGVVCVGALRPDGSVARFSNWGSQVDVFAPGEKILSTIPHSLPPLHISRRGYDFKNGTSQAAPFISAGFALLRGAYPEAPLTELYARLMATADSAIGESGLRGLFRIDAALTAAARSFVFPVLKGLGTVVIDDQGAFTLEIPFRNFWAAAAQTPVSFSCSAATLSTDTRRLPALATGERATLTVRGRMAADVRELDCAVSVATTRVPLKLKVLRGLPAATEKITVAQTDPLVVRTRLGVRSRLLSIPAVAGHTVEPLYYHLTREGVTVFRAGQRLGTLPLETQCNFLRAWQLQLDGHGGNELMIESMCGQSELQYQFLGADLREVVPRSRLKPTLAIINYDEFSVVSQGTTAPPTFRFLASGFLPAAVSAWDTSSTGRITHLYELRAVLKEGLWRYDTIALEDTQVWVRTLGLRYLPAYQVHHLFGGELLVRLGGKTARVNITTQAARWAPELDMLILSGTRRQRLEGVAGGEILQGLTTAYDYRGYLAGGVQLKFRQDDRFNPIIDVLGTSKTREGYLSVLRTFQTLVYLRFDENGAALGRSESTVDRFDFLDAAGLIASVIHLPTAVGSVQVVDGTKLNTQHLDVFKAGVLRSYAVPEDCVTQQPLVLEGRAVLPLFCAVDAASFEMRFFAL